MVRHLIIDEVDIEELDEFGEECRLFISFKDNDKYLRYYIVEENEAIGIFNDEIYCFCKGKITLCAEVKDIEFIFAFSEGD